VAQGRIWSGDAAVREHLVDHIGGFLSALARARDLGHVSDQVDAQYVPFRPSSLLDYVLQQVSDPNDRMRARAREGAPRERAISIPPELARALDFAIALDHIHEGSALAIEPAMLQAP
jgi:protease IV